MKNILIIGVAKSGKSTLGKMISNNTNYNKIPVDYFTSSLKYNFPELNISSNVVIEEETSIKLSLLLSRVLSLIDTTDEKYIIDSAHIMPKDIMPYIDQDKWKVICLGYPNEECNKKIKDIRKYETQNDWTYNNDDKKLLYKIEKLIKISKIMEHQCQKLNIDFIDTSHNVMKAIQKIYNNLEK